MDIAVAKGFLNLVKLELESTGNDGYFKLTARMGGSQLRVRFYPVEEEEAVNIVCTFDNITVSTISVDMEEKGKPVATKLMYLNLKDKYHIVKPPQFAAMLLLVKNAIEMSSVGTVPTAEQTYIFDNLLYLKDQFDIHYFSINFDENTVLGQFESNVEFIRLKVINKNISKLSADTKMETLGDNNKPVSHFHEVLDIPNEDPRDPSLKWLSSTSHTQIAVKKDTLNELLAYDSNFKHMGVPEIMDLVMKNYMNKGNSSTGAMKNISTDFRNSDK